MLLPRQKSILQHFLPLDQDGSCVCLSLEHVGTERRPEQSIAGQTRRFVTVPGQFPAVSVRTSVSVRKNGIEPVRERCWALAASCTVATPTERSRVQKGIFSDLDSCTAPFGKSCS